MRGLVFDIETSDIFSATKKKSEDLNLSVIGVYNYQTDEYKAFEQEELGELWEMMKDIDTLIGFNSNHFDIPILQKYAPFNLKKEFKSIDILEAVKQSLGRRIKLDWIAEGTLGEKKSGKGLDAVEWWKNGEKEKVKKYCLDDVRITKDIFDFMQKNKKAKYADFGTIHEITIDTSPWEEDGPKVSTRSLF